MSKLKRMRRKRTARKKANIRRMSSHGSLRETQATGKLLKRMTRDHVDVLQNIEFTIISAYDKDDSLDDCMIAEVLQAAVRDEVPDSARAQSLREDLIEMRHLRADVPDDIWRDGLRTILQSVQRHSNLKPGEQEYLDFVSDFIF